jgi:hypothetical protein
MAMLSADILPRSYTGPAGRRHRLERREWPAHSMKPAAKAAGV